MQYLLYRVAPKTKISGREYPRFDPITPIRGSHIKEFEEWVNDITSEYSKYPDLTNPEVLSKYYEFMKYFGEDQPNYKSPIDYNLKPEALNHFLKQLPR